MPIINKEEWEEWVKNNTDSYGGACVKVAEKAMEILDKMGGDFDCHKLICQADGESNAGGITGFMAGCVAQMISECHSRREEFRKKWNINNQIGNEGEKANKKGGILNPAIMTIQK